MFEEMAQGDEKAVFADKGYYKESRKRKIRQLGIYCGIMDKALRNRHLSSKQHRKNKRLSKIRSSVERVFGTLKRVYGMVRVRYVGFVKNQGHFYILGIAINLKRMLKLVQA